MSEPWWLEVLTWIAEHTGGVVEGGASVRIVRGQTAADAFILARRTGEQIRTEVEVLLRAPVETSAAAEPPSPNAPFRSAASTRRQVRGRPRIALGTAELVDLSRDIVHPNRALQTGNPRLDRAVCFESDASESEVREVLGAADLQNRAADLFERRCDSLYINDGGEWLTARFRLEPENPEEVERLRGLVDGFAALSNVLPVFVGPARKASWLPRLERTATLLVPVVGIAVGVAGTSWRPAIHEAPVAALAGAGVALWALYLVAVWIVLRRRHRGRRMSPRQRLRPLLWRGLLTFIGLPLFCLGSGFLINGRDSGALERHAVEVLAKTTGKGARRFLVVTEFRPNQRGSLKLEAGAELWERIEPGQKVVLVVGPGRLGWPWLSRIEWP